jgi:hypothetical protein
MDSLIFLGLMSRPSFRVVPFFLGICIFRMLVSGSCPNVSLSPILMFVSSRISAGMAILYPRVTFVVGIP